MPHEAAALCTTRIDSLSVRLGARPVLENIDLTLHCGEITAIIGPNGAGKTTLLRALLGLIPYSGRVSFQDAQGHPSRPPRVGYVPQRLDFDRLSPGTVCDLFNACLTHRPSFLGPSPRVRAQASAALKAVGAEPLLDQSPGRLSGGELQRALLALALTPMPELLLLDEPVSGVDARGLLTFYETVDHIRSTYDLTCVLVSHDLHTVASVADRVVLLQNRILAKGSPQEVYESAPFHTLFGASYTGGMPHGAGAS